MKVKQTIVAILRQFGLIDPADYLRFLSRTYKNSRKNNRFMKKNQGQKMVPPDIMMYEIFGDVDYFHYFRSGQKASDSIVQFIKEFSKGNKQNILEWGCGTGRIVSHLAEHRSEDFCIFASDINQEMIVWCQKHIWGVDFALNSINPPLPYKNDSMNVIYSTSVFTHLSKQLQKVWLDEIMRVLAPGGILIFTVHGDYYAKNKLNDEEQRLYNTIGFVERSEAKEGSRTLAVFQSAQYMKTVLLKGMDIVAYYDNHDYELAGSQDIWIVRK